MRYDLDADSFIVHLCRKMRDVGMSEKEYAEAFGYELGHFQRVMNGEEPPSQKILDGEKIEIVQMIVRYKFKKGAFK